MDVSPIERHLGIDINTEEVWGSWLTSAALLGGQLALAGELDMLTANSNRHSKHIPGLSSSSVIGSHAAIAGLAANPLVFYDEQWANRDIILDHCRAVMMHMSTYELIERVLVAYLLPGHAQ